MSALAEKAKILIGARISESRTSRKIAVFTFPATLPYFFASDELFCYN